MFDFLDLSSLIYRAPALLIALSMHEYAHAAVSDAMGDPTPSRMVWVMSSLFGFFPVFPS